MLDMQLVLLLFYIILIILKYFYKQIVNYYKEISKDLGTGVSKKDKSEKDIQYT